MTTYLPAIFALIVGALVGTAGVAVGQEVPHLDFVRALRNEYGPRLADEYLKRLKETAPAEFKPPRVPAAARRDGPT